MKDTVMKKRTGLGSFENQMPHDMILNSRHKALDELCKLTNHIALDYNEGRPDSCILTSYALAHVLRQLGHDAHPIRVQARAFPDDRKLGGCKLGGLPNGYRGEKASPDAWGGHLAVICGRYLLDP